MSSNDDCCSCSCHVPSHVLLELKKLLPQESQEENATTLIQRATSYIQSLLPSSPASSPISSPIASNKFIPLPNPLAVPKRHFSPLPNPPAPPRNQFSPLPNPPAPNLISTASVAFDLDERPAKRQRGEEQKTNADELVAMIEGATQDTVAYRTQHHSPSPDTTTTVTGEGNKLDSLLQAIENATDSMFQYRQQTRSEQWREYYQRLSILQRTQFTPSSPSNITPTTAFDWMDYSGGMTSTNFGYGQSPVV